MTPWAAACHKAPQSKQLHQPAAEHCRKKLGDHFRLRFIRQFKKKTNPVPAELSSEITERLSVRNVFNSMTLSNNTCPREVETPQRNTLYVEIKVHQTRQV